MAKEKLTTALFIIHVSGQKANKRLFLIVVDTSDD